MLLSKKRRLTGKDIKEAGGRKRSRKIVTPVYPFFSEKIDKYESYDSFLLMKTLYSALRYVKRTMVLGSGNKIGDHLKSGGWSSQAVGQRIIPKKYVKYKKKWVLEKSTEKDAGIFSVSSFDPLNDRYFKENKDLSWLIQNKIKLKRERAGNCNDLADLLACYLWENPSDHIFRVEVIEAIDFDHVWVLINRPFDTSLEDPLEWDDAWIIDPWMMDEGIIYPASEFHEKMLGTLEFFIHQKAALLELGYDFSSPLEEDQNLLAFYIKEYNAGSLIIGIATQIDIDVLDRPYPKVKIEDYYDSAPHYFSQYKEVYFNEKKAHKKQFEATLKMLNSPNLKKVCFKKNNFPQ